VCHGVDSDPVHRVCTVSADGREIVRSHGGQPGSDTGQFNVPSYLAVDNNEFVFVADEDNQRVTLLSPTLGHIGYVKLCHVIKSNGILYFQKLTSRILCILVQFGTARRMVGTARHVVSRFGLVEIPITLSRPKTE